MTVLEHLTKHYPLHVQRIVEAAVAGNGYKMAMCHMNSRVNAQELASAFLWAETPEGHEYWLALSRAEGIPPHEIVI